MKWHWHKIWWTVIRGSRIGRGVSSTASFIQVTVSVGREITCTKWWSWLMHFRVFFQIRCEGISISAAWISNGAKREFSEWPYHQFVRMAIEHFISGRLLETFHWRSNVHWIYLKIEFICNSKCFSPLASHREFSVSTRVLRDESRTEDSYHDFFFFPTERAANSHTTARVCSDDGVMLFNLIDQNAVGCWHTSMPCKFVSARAVRERSFRRRLLCSRTAMVSTSTKIIIYILQLNLSFFLKKKIIIQMNHYTMVLSTAMIWAWFSRLMWSSTKPGMSGCYLIACMHF